MVTAAAPLLTNANAGRLDARLAQPKPAPRKPFPPGSAPVLITLVVV